MLLEHRLSALLQLHLHSPLNTWLQYVAQRQLQAKTRNIWVLGFGASYIKRFYSTCTRRLHWLYITVALRKWAVVGGWQSKLQSATQRAMRPASISNIRSIDEIFTKIVSRIIGVRIFNHFEIHQVAPQHCCRDAWQISTKRKSISTRALGAGSFGP